MKTFITVSLLLAGLIVTCTARNIEADNNGLHGSSSSEESSETDAFMQEIETACYEKTGSSQTFEALIASFVGVPICMQINGTDLINDLHHLMVNASITHEFFPKYCPQIRNVSSCLDPLVQELSKCLDDDDALILHGVYNKIPKALDLICENDGFQEGASYAVCINNYFNYLDECGNLALNSMNLMDFSKIVEAVCGMQSQVRDCMQRKFNECKGPILMEVYDVIWHFRMKNSPCKNSITGPNEIEEDKAR